jgi:hypothetical protein
VKRIYRDLEELPVVAMETGLLIRSPAGTGRNVDFPDPRADAVHQIGETRLNNLQGEAKAA